jgi:hypothetical protein
LRGADEAGLQVKPARPVINTVLLRNVSMLRRKARQAPRLTDQYGRD